MSISNYYSSIEKWQELWEEVCQEQQSVTYGDNWKKWYYDYVYRCCGYCCEFNICKSCPLEWIVCGYYAKESLIKKLNIACKNNDYDNMVVYTWLILQEVSKKKYMKYFKGE